MKRKKIKGILIPTPNKKQVENNKKRTTIRRKYCLAVPQKICAVLKCRHCIYSITNSKIYRKIEKNIGVNNE